MRLVATFPADRSQQGKLQAFVGQAQIGEWPCLGKADNARAKQSGNPTRDPLKQFGDTPTGTWKVRVGTVQTDIATYGLLAPFTLWPSGGAALESHSPTNRRTGIWIHGGALNAAGGLRPTYGCIRVHDATMDALHALARKHGPIETLETQEK